MRRSLMLESKSSHEVETAATAEDIAKGSTKHPNSAGEKTRTPSGQIVRRYNMKPNIPSAIVLRTHADETTDALMNAQTRADRPQGT
jgi:hypothetical protein